MTEHEINQKAAEQICKTSAFNGKSFATGDCVALLDGKVVAVEKDLGAALRALRTLDSSPKRGMIFEVGPISIDAIR